LSRSRQSRRKTSVERVCSREDVEVYLSACVCWCPFLCLCLYVCLYLYESLFLCRCMCVCVCVQVSRSRQLRQKTSDERVLSRENVEVCLSVSPWLCLFLCVCVYVCVCVCFCDYDCVNTNVLPVSTTAKIL